MAQRQRFLLAFAAVFVATIAVLLLVTWLGSRSFAARASPGTLYVSPDGDDAEDCTDPLHPCGTVQRAMDVAAPGDAILVATGVYTGVQVRGGKTQAVYVSQTVTIRGGHSADFSAWDPDVYSTTLDARSLGRVVYFASGVTATLEGLRLTGGSQWNGGAVYALAARPIISACRIYSNTANNGGGIYLQSSDGAVLIGNIIYDNTTIGNGGGILIWGSDDVTMVNNVVVENQIGASSVGAGFNIYDSGVHLLHTTLARNRGGNGSGLYVAGGSTVAVTNTVLVSHTVGIVVGGGATPSTVTLVATLWGTGTWANETPWLGGGTIVHTTDVWGDPAFVDPDGGDYHIGAGSAAIDRGVDAGVTGDIDGDSRPVGRPDLGADEWGMRICLPLVLRNH